MGLSSTVVIGGSTRIIAPALLAQARVVSSQSLLDGDSASLEAVATASAVLFTSYRKTTEDQVDDDASLVVARLVLRQVSDPGRVLYLSTDHVFSGARGAYAAGDAPDPVSHYGRVKAAQEEVFRDGVVLRFTVMGPSFSTRLLMAEMVRSCSPLVAYPNVFFSPVSSWAINEVFADHVAGRMLPGIYHLASERVSKAELLRKLAERMGVSLQMQADGNVRADHSLLPSPALARSLEGEVRLASIQ